MRVDLFDFELPSERIALRPASPRDAARMLVVEPGASPELSDLGVRDLPQLLRSGDILVFNDTRVIPAQLSGTRYREGGEAAAVEITLARRLDGAHWQAFAKPGKRLKAGDRIRFGERGEVCFAGMLDATVEEKAETGEVTLGFSFTGAVLDEAIAFYGRMPLPPYIATRRPADEQDSTDYQTVYARQEGAVAAPTAGLHFTPELLSALQARGVGTAFVTLHVGPGTFLPVKVEDTADHRMHAEWGSIDAKTVKRLLAARSAGGRIVAVGTTSLRVLESAAAPGGDLRVFSGETDIFITPGFKFRAVDAILTNFHLPRSTLFMLVAAFSGLERMKRAYAHAISAGYRFYSYGDASLLFPAP
ncbi:MAG: tRNA preQ1(34) S-adenosylmethionine ribosyltransferase-isomerase QueA [Parvibaculaceae bacterium]